MWQMQMILCISYAYSFVVVTVKVGQSTQKSLDNIS